MSRRLTLQPMGLIVAGVSLAISLATAGEPQTVQRSAQKAFRTVREVCWPAERLKALKCEVEPLKGAAPAIQEFYHRGRLQRSVLDPMVMGQAVITQGAARLGDWIQSRVSGTNSCESVSQTARMCRDPVSARSEFELFKRLLNERARELESEVPEAARPCFKACLVKCVVSELISYNERENQEGSQFVGTRFFAGPEQIWSDGTGECSEIATLATSLGQGLGIPMKNVSTMVHEFNQTQIDGRAYSMDASSPGCIFFEDFLAR